jgi:hypothetical protein
MFNHPPRVQFESSPLGSLARKLKPRAPAFFLGISPGASPPASPDWPHEIKHEGVSDASPSRWRARPAHLAAKARLGAGLASCFFINFHKGGAAARNVVKKPNGILP